MNRTSRIPASVSALRAPVGAIAGIILMGLLVLVTVAPTSAQYTPKQLEALATRVGKAYWVAVIDGRSLAILSAPSANAASFTAVNNESFEIVEIVRQMEKDPYYKVRFESGKEGYIRPEDFVEELNLTIMTADPLAGDKKKAADAAEQERQRVEWIQSQPWPASVKAAAIKRMPVAGLTQAEVKHILGNPLRVTKVSRQRVAEERWHYADGSVLIFHNHLLSQVDLSGKKAP